MPELPEVETTMRGLAPLLAQTVGQVVIRQSSLRWPIPQHLLQTLVGQRLHNLSRRAKYILARFDTGTLLLHLGMSGRICLLAQDEAPAKHDHFDLHFTDGQVLRLRDPRRFGAVLWIADSAAAQGEFLPPSHALLDSLGPEPLDPDFNGEYLFHKTRHRNVVIKVAIMDSHLVVGVGNIYASESLFRARISPLTPAGKLTRARCDRLVAEIQATLRDAIQAGGSSLRDFFGADGNPGYFQQEYFVYGRTGQPCKVCGAPILQIKQGQRSTFYCKHCQK